MKAVIILTFVLLGHNACQGRFLFNYNSFH